MLSWKLNIIFCILLDVVILVLSDFYKLNKFTFKVTEDGRQKLFKGLKKNKFKELYQIQNQSERIILRATENGNTKIMEITPSTFVFEYTGNRDAAEAFDEVKNFYKDEIVACEPVKVYENTLKPGAVPTHQHVPQYDDIFQTNLVCSNYYGFNVSEVWSKGITGKGVTIAVNDVGVDIELLDLAKNINTSLSKNFLTDSDDVKPEEFPNLKDKAAQFRDHGNRVSSLVAATMANDFCSAGIAYNASIAPLKIFMVTLKNNFFDLDPDPDHWTSSVTIGRSLSYALDEIDIFVNAWTTTKIFDNLDLTTREALANGVKSGRRGLGTIYVVPSGPAGNELSNNINTVTIGSIGQFGRRTGHFSKDASVITSGLEEGNNLTANYMVTTSEHDKCINSFKGVSAATAQVAGIIALGLQKNSSLTQRDVLYLCVHSSEYKGLNETKNFRRNGAGLYFHDQFGYGLLNALTLVQLAEKHTRLPIQLSQTLACTDASERHNHIQTFECCFSCDVTMDPSCLTTVEYAEVTITFETNAKYLHMELISPDDTHSVLVDHKAQQTELATARQGRLLSVHFWEESPFGIWKFKIKQGSKGYTHVSNIFLTVYGTKRDEPQKHTDKACKKVSTATTAVNSDYFSQISPVTTDTSINKGIYVVIPVALVIIVPLLVFIYKKGGVHPLPIYDGKPIKDVKHKQSTKTVLLAINEVTVDSGSDREGRQFYFKLYQKVKH